MKPKLLLFAHPSPASWVAYYIKAFRAIAEVRVVGPPPDAEKLAAWNRVGLEAQVPDVDVPVAFDADFDLDEVLGDWQPDLAIGISGIGGDALYPGTLDLPCPTAFITVDTWQCLTDYPEARNYDFVFAAQREFVETLHDSGARKVQWLPLACDPEAHAPAPPNLTHDIAFAGSTIAPVHVERRRVLEGMHRNFRLYHQEHAFGADLPAAFARGAIAFNHSAVEEINMRIFEVMAMGRPLLTNAAAGYNGLHELFAEGEHLVTYTDEHDLMQRVQALLVDDAARDRIAQAGRDEVLRAHTYTHRAETILETIRPWIGHKRTEGDLLDWLPPDPGRVLDIGFGLDVTPDALKRRGAERLMGMHTVTPEAAANQPGNASITGLPGISPLESDTAVIAGTLPLDYALREAHQSLVPGGTLLLRTSPETLGMVMDDPHLRGWLLEHGFHLRRFRMLQGDLHVEARRRTRSLREIAAALFTRLQVPGVEVPDLIPRIPEIW